MILTNRSEGYFTINIICFTYFPIQLFNETLWLVTYFCSTFSTFWYKCACYYKLVCCALKSIEIIFMLQFHNIPEINMYVHIVYMQGRERRISRRQPTQTIGSTFLQHIHISVARSKNHRQLWIDSYLHFKNNSPWRFTLRSRPINLCFWKLRLRATVARRCAPISNVAAKSPPKYGRFYNAIMNFGEGLRRWLLSH